MKNDKYKNQHVPNKVYRTIEAHKTTPKGTLVVFLGYQDDKTFGFFRLLSDSNTFFGLPVNKLELVENWYNGGEAGK